MVTNILKNYLKILLALCFLSTETIAQTNHTIGTGSTTYDYSTYPTPFGDWYEGSRSQYLYLASELQAAGMTAGSITGIKFQVTDLQQGTTTSGPSGVHVNSRF